MGVVSFVVTALSEPSFCLPAANALKELCDANRVALAPHISAFGSLHASLSSIPVSTSTRAADSWGLLPYKSHDMMAGNGEE